MGGYADVLAGFYEEVEQVGEGLAGPAGEVAGHGEEGGEFGVVGELGSRAFERRDRVRRAVEAQEADGVADQGVGLFGRGGEAEGERAFVGGESAGVVARGGKGEGQLGGDLGPVGVLRIQVADTRGQAVDASAVAGADDGVEDGFPVGHGGWVQAGDEGAFRVENR